MEQDYDISESLKDCVRVLEENYLQKYRVVDLIEYFNVEVGDSDLRGAWRLHYDGELIVHYIVNIDYKNLYEGNTVTYHAKFRPVYKDGSESEELYNYDFVILGQDKFIEQTNSFNMLDGNVNIFTDINTHDSKINTKFTINDQFSIPTDKTEYNVDFIFDVSASTLLSGTDKNQNLVDQQIETAIKIIDEYQSSGLDAQYLKVNISMFGENVVDEASYQNLSYKEIKNKVKNLDYKKALDQINPFSTSAKSLVKSLKNKVDKYSTQTKIHKSDIFIMSDSNMLDTEELLNDVTALKQFIIDNNSDITINSIKYNENIDNDFLFQLNNKIETEYNVSDELSLINIAKAITVELNDYEDYTVKSLQVNFYDKSNNLLDSMDLSHLVENNSFEGELSNQYINSFINEENTFYSFEAQLEGGDGSIVDYETDKIEIQGMAADAHFYDADARFYN